MPKLIDKNFDPDNIPKKETQDNSWVQRCPICESLVMEMSGEFKCSTCGHSETEKDEPLTV